MASKRLGIHNVVFSKKVMAVLISFKLPNLPLFHKESLKKDHVLFRRCPPYHTPFTLTTYEATQYCAQHLCVFTPPGIEHSLAHPGVRLRLFPLCSLTDLYTIHTEKLKQNSHTRSQ